MRQGGLQKEEMRLPKEENRQGMEPPFKAEMRRPAMTARPRAAPAPRPPKMKSRARRKGALASARAPISARVETPPLAFSKASSHSLLSRSALKSGSCPVIHHPESVLNKSYKGIHCYTQVGASGYNVAGRNWQRIALLSDSRWRCMHQGGRQAKSLPIRHTLTATSSFRP